jgi:hypothetical protein
LQDHNCRCDAFNCHLEPSFPGLRASRRHCAAHNRHLGTRNSKIVNLPLAITSFICCRACFHSIGSIHRSPAFGALLVRRRMQRSLGGRDPPFGTIEQLRSLSRAVERKGLRESAGPRLLLTTEQRR